MIKVALKYFILSSVLDSFFDKLIREFTPVKLNSFDIKLTAIGSILYYSIIYEGLKYSDNFDLIFYSKVGIINKMPANIMRDWMASYASRGYKEVISPNMKSVLLLEIKNKLIELCETDEKFKKLLG